MDEVDILFNDKDFEVALQSLISSAPVTAQYLFVTATLPVDIYNKLVEVFPDCKVVMGPSMHRISSGLEEVSNHSYHWSSYFLYAWISICSGILAWLYRQGNLSTNPSALPVVCYCETTELVCSIRYFMRAEDLNREFQ